MATYLYECPRCGEFETEHPMSQPPLERCPTCGDAVRRLIAGGTSGFVRGQGSARSHCDRSTPCCGRESRCDRSPCQE
jgi:putative FmdB family regulatory protein